MTGWKVELSGDKSDLKILAMHFTGPDLRVEPYEDRYVLSSSDFAALNDAKSVLDHARGLLELMNGAMYLVDPTQRPVAVTGLFYLRDGGKRDVFLFPETLHARVRMIGAVTVGEPGAVPPRPTAGLARVNAARSNRHIDEVIRGLADAKPDFGVLHRLLEAVELDMAGGEDEITARGWATRSELKLFGQTANTIGRRHASGKFDPPKNPMHIEDARALIRRVATAWLRDIHGVA